MQELIVLVVLIWILGLMIGKPLRNLARAILATLLGGALLVVRLVSYALFWTARLVVIVLLLLAAYLVYRRIRNSANSHRHNNDHWPPLPPL